MPGRPAGYAPPGLSVLLLVVGIGSGISGASRLTAREDDAEAVLRAATGSVEAYGYFDATVAASYRARLLGLTTDELRAALAEASISADAAALRRSTSTKVESATVTALSGENATAHVIAVRQRRWVDRGHFTSPTSHEATARKHVALRLVSEQGRSLVAELRLLSEAPAHRDGR